MTLFNEKIKIKLLEIKRFIDRNEKFLVVGHHDADGLTSTAIICKMLKREGKSFETLTLKQLYQENIDEIKEKVLSGEKLIFVDFGSGQADFIADNFSEFAIIDHHETIVDIEEDENKIHLNAHLVDLDGNNEISGAGMCFLLAYFIDEKNADLAPMAVVGALGDIMDYHGALKGLARDIAVIGEQAGVLKIDRDIRLYGRISRPLVQFIMFSTSPSFQGLTANEEGCVRFLTELGIELKNNGEWVSYIDLTPDEQKKLISGLMMNLIAHNEPQWKLDSLIGEVYTLITEGVKAPTRDAKEFATMLNACGRHKQAKIGLEVAMGDRGDYYLGAIDMLRQHRLALRKGIEFALSTEMAEKQNFYYFDAGSVIQDSLVGIIGGMIYSSGKFEETKAIISFADINEEEGESEYVKMSSRATAFMVRKGLNLGQAIKKICKAEGCGEGGGHNIAAGAKILKDRKEEFLKLLDTEITKQLS